MMSEKLDILEATRLRYNDACDKLNLDPSVYEILKEPERILEVAIPVKMDKGYTKVFKGYRSAHSSALGPSKGGVRFDDKVTREEVEALSMMMSIKVALLGLPLGGGKGGICVNPKELSERELELLSRAYVRSINNYLGSRQDVPAPDVNTNAKIMGYFIDEYISLNEGKQDIATFTGKPLALGGSFARDQATGFGVALSVKYYYQRKNESLEGKTFICQGFGNVGYFTCKYLKEFGAKLIAVNASDKNAPSGSSAIVNKNGFDPEALLELKEAGKSVLDFEAEGTKKISNEEFFGLDTDILLPCALENVITEDIAKSIKAEVISEGANGPTTPLASDFLEAKGVTIIPDIMANSGGVLVSHYEWIQNQLCYYFSYDQVKDKEEEDMLRVFKRIFDMAEEKDVDLRQASFMVAIKSMAEALKFKGRY